MVTSYNYFTCFIFLLFPSQTLVCISHLCRVCPSLVPEILVEYETDLKLFNILFSREEQNSAGGDISDQETGY